MSFLDVVAGFLAGIVALFSVIFGHRQPDYVPPDEISAAQQQTQAATAQRSSAATASPSQQSGQAP